jgi:putative peptidoglycan lipid II flippase
MLKGFRTIAVLTAISRVLGFARDTAYAVVFGPGTLLDAWFIAFRIPNLGRRLFGEGAAAASIVPVYSEQLQKDPATAGRLARTVISALFIVLVVLVIFGEGIIGLLSHYWGDKIDTKLVLSLTAVTLPYMILICLVAVIAGLLNVHRHFAMPALAPVIMNVFIIGGTITAAVMFPVHIAEQGGSASEVIRSFSQPAVRQVFVVAVAVIIAGIFEFGIQVPPFAASGLSLRPAWDVRAEPFRRILRLMAPMIIGLAATQINTLVDDIIAWVFSGSPEKGEFFTLLGQQVRYPLWRGSVSYLGYAQHLYQLPLGIFGISLATALFPVMSTHAAKKDYNELCRTVSLGVRSSIFVALPCTIGLILVAKPFISVWLRHGNFRSEDVAGVVWPLIFYSLGITGYFLQHMMVRAFHSLQDPVPPVRTGLLAVAVNFLLNITLIWPLGTGGLAASTAICSYLQITILAVLLRKRLGHSVLEGFALTAVKTALATALMAAAAITIYWLLSQKHNLVKLSVVIPVCAAVFIIAALLLRIPEISLLTGKRRPPIEKTPQ